MIEVNSLLTNLERSLLRLLGEDISVQCHFDRGKDGLHTKVDPGQLTQIILNLVVNARDAMRYGGRLTLETASGTIDASEEQEIDAPRNSSRANTFASASPTTASG